MSQDAISNSRSSTPLWCVVTVVVSAIVGLALIADQSVKLSTTYDEVTYLRVAAHWWRTGEQETISRMGSPLTVWKIQQAPTLWVIDRLGLGAWIDEPITHQEKLLPVIRIGESWIWLAAFLITVNWARMLDGPRSMAMAAILFALSPNLLAHGALSTMELPLVACTSAMFFGFWTFLKFGRKRDFWATAAIGGLAMSCKFTTILIPPILALLWVIDLALKSADTDRPGAIRRWFLIVRKVALSMILFAAVMLASNLVVTGFAMIPLSAREGHHPVLDGRIPPRFEKRAGQVLATSFPQDWVGLATQLGMQWSGGPSYLFGERRMTGWRHYYLVAMAVKVPLAFWLLAVARMAIRRRRNPEDRAWVLPVILISFLLAAMLGSKRNYGFRYLLPIAPPAIVWVSSLAQGGFRARLCAGVGLAGMGLAVATTHPHELSYFNELTHGPIGGRKVLSDSNLDWGQGAKALARLQRAHPEYRDLTLYYFGDTDPGWFGVEGRRLIFDANNSHDVLPPRLTAETKYLGVSASLQWGPLGPPGYFRLLDAITPVVYTDDTTIAIYRTADLEKLQTDQASAGEAGLKTGRDHE
jgi:hypothetical protein